MINLSVIITTYNDSEHLSNSVASIVSQDLKPSELIVVDDGSNSMHRETVINTINRIKKDSQFPIKLIHKPNGGPSSARNVGLQQSTGEYIAFLDADDTWKCNRISNLLPVLRQTNANYAAIYTGASITINNKTEHEKYISNIEINNRMSDLIGKTNGVACGAPFYIFKKSALFEVNGFDETLRWNEDLDLILRILGNGYTLVGVDDYSFCRNERATSHSKNQSRESYDHIMRFLEKNKELGNLSQSEYAIRKKYNSLLFLKNALKNFSAKDVKFYFDMSFSKEPPTTYRQKTLYLLSRFFLFLHRLN